ncbi:replication factor C subunit 5-like [Watersipora subatra]|uniref:replication factor C subunit 5-like n=1 Tax=Watersipora subatra TaxID=2589382 RepID=UPI00355B7655
MPEQRTTNLPWVEKYRPRTFDELISHKDILNTINRFVSEDRLPHLLLYGPPGTGKTTTILAVARQLYPKNSQFNAAVLELNASDERGIDVVREKVLTFASTRSMFTTGFKIIILDEADAMTKDAQNALRRIVEKYTENVRFCFICNYLSKMIPAIQSRCTRFRFAPLSRDQMLPRLQHVSQEENIQVKDDGMRAVVRLAGGDMRRALNMLQSTSLSHDVVTEDSVYTCVGHPLRKDINKIAELMLNKPFNEAFTQIKKIQRDRGLALQDILDDLHTLVHKIDFSTQLRLKIVDKLCEIEYRLSGGTNEKLQLSAMIAAFQLARDPLIASMETS